MTVAELITQLQGLDKEALVVMSEDAEGNRFSPLFDVEPARYIASSAWSGDLVDEDDDDPDPEAVQSVCLWPTN